MHLARPNGTYFKSNCGRWAPLVICHATEPTALGSESIRLHLGHLNAVDFFLKNYDFCVREFRKTARYSFLNPTITKKTCQVKTE
jgi:hypothetical protein